MAVIRSTGIGSWPQEPFFLTFFFRFLFSSFLCFNFMGIFIKLSWLWLKAQRNQYRSLNSCGEKRYTNQLSVRVTAISDWTTIQEWIPDSLISCLTYPMTPFETIWVKARGHFMTYIEVGMHLIRCNPGHPTHAWSFDELCYTWCCIVIIQDLQKVSSIFKCF